MRCIRFIGTRSSQIKAIGSSAIIAWPVALFAINSRFVESAFGPFGFLRSSVANVSLCCPAFFGLGRSREANDVIGFATFVGAIEFRIWQIMNDSVHRQ